MSEPNKLPDNFWFSLKFADESWAGTWKLPKELSSLNCWDWDESKNLSGSGWKEGAGGKKNVGDGPGAGGRGNAGGDGGGERLLSSFGSYLSLSLFNRFLIAISTPGGVGACLIRSLDKFFLPTSSSLRREPTIGFSHQT